MSDQENKSGINWGGLAKGLLAGAAIVAGVMIVCPGAVDSVVSVIKGLGPSAVNAMHGYGR